VQRRIEADGALLNDSAAGQLRNGDDGFPIRARIDVDQSAAHSLRKRRRSARIEEHEESRVHPIEASRSAPSSGGLRLAPRRRAAERGGVVVASAAQLAALSVHALEAQQLRCFHSALLLLLLLPRATPLAALLRQRRRASHRARRCSAGVVTALLNVREEGIEGEWEVAFVRRKRRLRPRLGGSCKADERREIGHCERCIFFSPGLPERAPQFVADVPTSTNACQGACNRSWTWSCEIYRVYYKF
jgi:hypothetical protein